MQGVKERKEEGKGAKMKKEIESRIKFYTRGAVTLAVLRVLSSPPFLSSTVCRVPWRGRLWAISFETAAGGGT